MKLLSLFRHIRLVHSNSSTCLLLRNYNKDTVSNFESSNQVPRAVQSKYKPFKDEESPVIFDLNEEKNKIQEEETEVNMEFYNLNLKRGISGVFEIEDLVDTLKKENAIDIIVCRVPNYLKYVDYICIVTGKSYRHMLAIAEFVRRLFKKKRFPTDLLPKIEGEKSKDWMALDLGNIALHIFSTQARKTYDLESLWSIGYKYDAECNKSENLLVELLTQHSKFLNDLTPNQSSKQN